ncbi:MAG: hypothetical protein Q7S40_05230 [Opitutaceae bacterium]|nr:hypothetical protein [Opitutaceae bacterium]
MPRLPSQTLLLCFAIGGLVAALPVRAVYAPVPERDQGKDLTVTVRAGVAYDSNLFGAPPKGSLPVLPGQPPHVGPLDSIVWTFAPHVAYNASLTDQTFMSAAYGLTLDYFQDRPGDKLLDSHDVALRVAHAVSKSTTLDVNNVLTVARNPEALLPGIATLPGVAAEDRSANPDQSFTRNQLDGRFNTPLNAKLGATVKARSVLFDYRNAQLGRSLDRLENLYGVAGDYAILPEVKAVAEYRHQDVYYRKFGEAKNKRSDYLMGGADYEVAKKMSVSGRLGAEWRQRAGERSSTSPFAELSGKYDYSRESFVIGGYAYTFDETSDTVRFTDMKVNRFFLNLQHSLTALIVASASASYEPSELQGRRGQADIDEKTSRFGGALSYLPTKNWILSVSYDYDRVRSDDPARGMRRERVGLNAIYAF